MGKCSSIAPAFPSNDVAYEENSTGINLGNHMIQKIDEVTQEHAFVDKDEKLSPFVIITSQ